MIEGYCYKIIFADGCWYWGTSRYKGLPPEKDGYYGSPVTHKAKWEEPHSKVVIKLFYDEQTRLDYEEMCILPDLNNPKCLNEHAKKGFSREVCLKAAAVSASRSRGVPRPLEVKEKISQKTIGRKLTPEHVQKLKDVKRPPVAPEAIAKRVESRKGYRHSKETRRKIGEGNQGRVRSEELCNLLAEIGREFNWYNNGEISVRARTSPGENWVEGRILDWETPRNKGMKWYHKDGEHKMFREDPGNGWILGRPRASGKRYYNNGTEHVLAHECPGEGWVLGRLKKR